MPDFVRVTDPLTLDVAKSHLRIDTGFVDDDAYITSLIDASLEYAERACWRYLLRADVGWTVAEGFTTPITLDGTDQPSTNPVIGYTDQADQAQTVPEADYSWSWTPRATVNGGSAPATGTLTIYSASGGWPEAKEGAPITVDYAVGIDPMPGMIIQARLMMIGSWYEHREENVVGQTTNELSFGVQRLLDLWTRRFW